MSSYIVGHKATYLLNGYAQVQGEITWGFQPSSFIWVTAQPTYPRSSVELINKDNWMDQNRIIHHNFILKNNTPNAAECKVICLTALP